MHADDPNVLTYDRLLRAMTTAEFHVLSGGRDYLETEDGYLALIDGQVIRATLPPETLAMRHYHQARQHAQGGDQ